MPDAPLTDREIAEGLNIYSRPSPTDRLSKAEWHNNRFRTAEDILPRALRELQKARRATERLEWFFGAIDAARSTK